MPEKSDVDFTFDTTGFRNGLKQVASGIANVGRNTMNMAKNVSKGVINAAAKIGVLKLAFRGIQSAIKEMPEIGKTFTIAKDIIMKNFLFPVRKAIFPVLQKILDWVRDNRAMFVKWGQSLVTIFNVVSKAIGNVIDLGKRLLSAFGDFFNRTFGTQIKSFNDLLNIMSFKFAVVVQFISRLLEPLIGIIEPLIKTISTNLGKILKPVGSIAGHILDIATGLLGADGTSSSLLSTFDSILSVITDVAKFALEMVDAFVEGLKPNIGPIVKDVNNLFKEIKNVVDKLLGGEESLKNWKEVFKWIGDNIGKLVQKPLEAMGFVFKGIGQTIDIIKGVGEGIGDFFTGEGKEEKVKDAIIKPDGTVIRTDPADYIIATKTPGMAAPGVGTINLDFTGMNINIQRATPEEAVRFGESIVDEIRSQFTKELERMGIK